jgi:hypothetical protein
MPYTTWHHISPSKLITFRASNKHQYLQTVYTASGNDGALAHFHRPADGQAGPFLLIQLNATHHQLPTKMAKPKPVQCNSCSREMCLEFRGYGTIRRLYIEVNPWAEKSR